MHDRELEVRAYGSTGPLIVLLHGGPGAAGYLAPLGRALAARCRVLEPYQRGSGGEPLTVARHVHDLEHFVRSRCGPERPVLAGHSWGAMLTLAYAVEHADELAGIVLIGCGTFDPAARERLEATRATRMSPALRERVRRIALETGDPDQALARTAEALLPLDSFELAAREPMGARCDARAHAETWNDMLALQENSVYPAAFTAIDAPVLMLHGAHDPHPGAMIRTSLERHLPRFEYRELERCGHYPWLERHARREFLDALSDWVERAWANRAGR
jgi:pimeloyl-ACP methyl ester carboxylesterase